MEKTNNQSIPLPASLLLGGTLRQHGSADQDRKNRLIDPHAAERYLPAMHAIEFTTGSGGSRMPPIPQDVAAQLPKTVRARIIVLTGNGSVWKTDEAGSQEPMKKIS